MVEAIEAFELEQGVLFWSRTRKIASIATSVLPCRNKLTRVPGKDQLAHGAGGSFSPWEYQRQLYLKGSKKPYRRPTYFRLNRRQSGKRWIGSYSVQYNSGKSQRLEVPITFAPHRKRSSCQRVQLCNLNQPFIGTRGDHRRRRHDDLFISLRGRIGLVNS